MSKEMRLKALKELKNEFVLNDKMRLSVLYELCSLVERDFIVGDMDIYEVNVSSYSKSMIDGWQSHVEDSKHYDFYVEMAKIVNGKKVVEFVRIDNDNIEFLKRLYEILKS